MGEAGGAGKGKGGGQGGGSMPCKMIPNHGCKPRHKLSWDIVHADSGCEVH